MCSSAQQRLLAHIRRQAQRARPPQTSRRRTKSRCARAVYPCWWRVCAASEVGAEGAVEGGEGEAEVFAQHGEEDDCGAVHESVEVQEMVVGRS